ncbi:MAG: MFS transporter [Halodesulfurarchaeum sp.]
MSSGGSGVSSGGSGVLGGGNGLADGLRELIRDRTSASLLLAYFLLFAVVTTYQQAIPLLYRPLGIPIAAFGLAKSVGNGLEAIASTPAGVLADEAHTGLIAILAGVVMAVALGAFPFATTATALGILVVVMAVSRLVLGVALTPLVDAALTAGHEGIGWGVRDLAIYLGSAVGLGLAGAFVVRSGTLVSIFPGLSLGIVALVALLVATHRPTRGDLPDVGTLRPSGLPSPRSSIEEISNRGVLLRILGVDLLVTLGMGMSFFLVPVLAVDVGVEAGEFLLVFGGSHLLAAPLSLAGGALTDRLPRKLLYVGNYAAETLMLAALALADGPVLFALGLALFVLQTGFEPAVLAYFFDQFDESESGRAWGIDGTVERGAGLVAPALGGVLYGMDPHLPFVAGTVLVAGGTLLALTLPR